MLLGMETGCVWQCVPRSACFQWYLSKYEGRSLVCWSQLLQESNYPQLCRIWIIWIIMGNCHLRYMPWCQHLKVAFFHIPLSCAQTCLVFLLHNSCYQHSYTINSQKCFSWRRSLAHSMEGELLIPFLLLSPKDLRFSLQLMYLRWGWQGGQPTLKFSAQRTIEYTQKYLRTQGLLMCRLDC